MEKLNTVGAENNVMLINDEKKGNKYLVYILIAVITALLISLSIVGICLLYIFMQDDGSWKPFENIKVGRYLTQENCADIFGSNNVEIEIIKVKTEDINGETALSLISDELVLNVTIDENKSDIHIIRTHYEYNTDNVYFSFILDNLNIHKTIFCEAVSDFDGGPRTALAFFVEESQQEHSRAVFKRVN